MVISKALWWWNSDISKQTCRALFDSTGDENTLRLDILLRKSMVILLPSKTSTICYFTASLLLVVWL